VTLSGLTNQRIKLQSGGGGATRPLRGMGAWRNSTETQQSGHASRFGPEVKNGSSAKDGAPERLGYGTIQEKMSHILQRVSVRLHQRVAASTWWCSSRPLFERWAEMARQLSQGNRPSGCPQSSGNSRPTLHRRALSYLDKAVSARKNLLLSYQLR